MTRADRTRMIGVALAPKHTAAAVEALRRVAAVADIAELRLDLMDEFDLPLILESRPCPVIVTYRPEREGGSYRGSEDARVAVLRQAIALGAEYIDIELDSVARIDDRGATGLIVSHHDFSAMPTPFQEFWRAIRSTNADVVKLVGTVRDARETLPIFDAFAQADRPTIAIAMGQAGVISRVLALKYRSCFLTFCALDGDGGTAPGQVSVSDMIEVYRGRQITEHTTVYGLIGTDNQTEPVRMYNAKLQAADADAVAVPLAISGDTAELIAAFRVLDVRGYHVQAPHQENIGQALDEIDRSACRAGKVNLVYTRGDALVGAWVESPSEQIELWLGAPVGPA